MRKEDTIQQTQSCKTNCNEIEDFLFFPTGKVNSNSESRKKISEEEPFFEFACIQTDKVVNTKDKDC